MTLSPLHVLVGGPGFHRAEVLASAHQLRAIPGRPADHVAGGNPQVLRVELQLGAVVAVRHYVQVTAEHTLFEVEEEVVS